MLEAALKVVEAARALGLIEQEGLTRSPLNRHTLAMNLSALRASIDRFDYETADGFVIPELVAKPDFATPPQIDDEGSHDLDINLSPDFLPGVDASRRREVLKDDPELALSSELSQILDKKSVSALSAPVLFPGTRRPARPGLNADYSDLDDTVFFDNDESVGAFMIAIDRIEDKISYVIHKNGWNPRLKRLAAALVEFRNRMMLEISREGVSARVPAHVFSDLASTIADAVLDADMRMSVPQLRLSLNQTREKELEYVHRPKPRFHD